MVYTSKTRIYVEASGGLILVFRTVSFLFLISLGVHQSLPPFPRGDSAKTSGLDLALHLIFFEDYPYTVSSETEPGNFNVVDLPSAGFPQQFSCMYAPFRKLQHFTLPEGLQIPRKVILLSIHTLSEQTLRGNQASHRSPFTGLSYELKTTQWEDHSYQLALSGEYKGFKFENIPIEVHTDRTVLAMIRKTSRQTLYAFLTPVQAIPLFSDLADSSDSSHPLPLENPQPRYPAGLSAQGRVVIRGVISAEGKLDPDRFVLLECPHPLLAESALATIIDHWQFLPATREGIPVEALTTIEVHFAPE